MLGNSTQTSSEVQQWMHANSGGGHSFWHSAILRREILRFSAEVGLWNRALLLPKDRATGSGGVLRTARDSFELRDQYSGFRTKTQQGALTADY